MLRHSVSACLRFERILMLRIILGKGEGKRLRSGHPWVFSNEIGTISGDRAQGAAAEVYDAGGDYIGTGHYNPRSLIAVRLLSRSREDIESAGFFRNKIEKANAYRRAVYPELTAYRVVYGEADHLSGLVVDRYHDCLVLQFLSAGMDLRKDIIVGTLIELFNPAAIVARNDVPVRALEGLNEGIEILHGKVPDTVYAEEHGLRFRVDLLTGQKTGHFLDQKENHLLLKEYAGGKDVLDCFCYSGSWGVHAAVFGASSVLCVDASERALALAAENGALNGVSAAMRFEAADAFERLRSLKYEGRRFDLVVMDPPAFVKSRKALKEAQKGYLTINRRAMDLLRPGGILITCSCSYHMEREMFRELLKSAAQQAGREMRLVAARSQAYDHPVLLTVPETEYLKCLVLQAVE